MVNHANYPQNTNEKNYVLYNKPVTGKIKGSRLIYELSKLRESSVHAVENIEEFSEYKQYLHVEREVEMNLRVVLNEVSGSSLPTLILLSGSVGDGKSHLLGRLRHQIPEIMSRFKVHNDATESFNPNQNSLDTLDIVLSSFRDENIRQNSDKLILAINLGILHNFLESKFASKYTKLKRFIENTHLFKVGVENIRIASDYFRLINFGDYELFELTNSGIKSEYIQEVLNRITEKNNQNPFYQAYIEDVENGVGNIVIKNFELLQREDVQQRIIKLIAKTVFFHKEIISARGLFNFLYDIVVPYQLEECEHNPDIYLSNILPNLLFESRDKSKLLSNMQYHDPINFRNQEIDRLMLDYSNSDGVVAFFKNNVALEEDDLLLDNLRKSLEMKSINDEDLLKTFIRLFYFMKSSGEKFDEYDFFDDYIATLHGYHTFDQTILGEFSHLIRDAVSLWNGSPKEDYVYVSSKNEPVKIAYKLHYEIDSEFFESFTENKNALLRSYSLSMVMSFIGSERKGLPVQIDIDLPLYSMLRKVVLGYRPNKKDREDSFQMEEFMRNLIRAATNSKKILMHMNVGNNLFYLSSEKIFAKEKYIFRKENI